jgi:hypothetical protein
MLGWQLPQAYRSLPRPTASWRLDIPHTPFVAWPPRHRRPRQTQPTPPHPQTLMLEHSCSNTLLRTDWLVVAKFRKVPRKPRDLGRLAPDKLADRKYHQRDRVRSMASTNHRSPLVSQAHGLRPTLSSNAHQRLRSIAHSQELTLANPLSRAHFRGLTFTGSLLCARHSPCTASDATGIINRC